MAAKTERPKAAIAKALSWDTGAAPALLNLK